MKGIIVVIGSFILLSFQTSGQEGSIQLNDEEYFYGNENLIVTNIYPNPASNVAIVNYSILEPEKEAKIIIHDLLGTMTKDYPLSPFETTLKIDIQDFREGVYFYTLNTDGESKVTKKLIVKK